MAVLAPGVPFVSADAVISVEGLAPGTHRIRLEVEDDAGNRSAPDERRLAVVVPTPVITDFRPRFGAWGEEVLILGRGFDADPQKNRVEFSDGVATAVIDATTTQLRVRVPQPAVTGAVVVRNAAGQAASPQPFVIARSFAMRLGGPAPVDLAHEPRRGEVWVVHGPPIGTAGFSAVSVLVLRTRELAATLLVQRGAREIAIAPPVERQAAAVTNASEGTVTIIDVESRAVRAHVRVSANPNGVAFRSDGRIAYVVCEGDATAGAGIVMVIDVADQPRVVARIPLGRQPARVVFAPDGKLAFVNEVGDGTVAIIDATEHRVIDRVKVGGVATSQPSEVAVSPETFPLLVANPGNRSLSIVAADHSVRDVDAGIAASAAAIDPRAKRGWLAGPSHKTVVTIDMGEPAPKRIAAPAPGDGPKSVVMQVEGRGVFVANPQAGTVSVFDASSGTLRALVVVPEGPTRGVCSADGALACFICTAASVVVAIEVASVLP